MILLYGHSGNTRLIEEQKVREVQSKSYAITIVICFNINTDNALN